uniref:hypothetical protein n=2 Tax=Sphingomonas sp. GlSt437 TaxID=3389970 RepID=UPI003A895800
MVRMSDVWDRATEFLGDNLRALAPIGLLIALLLAFQQGLTVMKDGAAPGTSALISIVGFVASIVALVARLGVQAFAIDTNAGLSEALARVRRRVWVVIGVFFLLGIAAVVLFIPFFALMIAGGVPPTAFNGNKIDPAVFQSMPGWVGWSLFVYGLALVVGLLWIAARLSLTVPVVLFEQQGIGAFGRSFELTRGLALRILGALILIGLVGAVAALAAKAVFGSVLRLALGDGGPLGAGAVLTILIVAIVATVFSLIGDAFTGKLYVAARGGLADAGIDAA